MDKVLPTSAMVVVAVVVAMVVLELAVRATWRSGRVPVCAMPVAHMIAARWARQRLYVERGDLHDIQVSPILGLEVGRIPILLGMWLAYVSGSADPNAMLLAAMFSPDTNGYLCTEYVQSNMLCSITG